MVKPTGRPRKPTSLKITEGQYRPDRDGGDGIDPSTRLTIAPLPPDCLSQEGKRIWRATAPELVKVGLLTIGSVQTLTMYCRLWDELHAVSTTIGKLRSDYIHHESGNVTIHPAIKRRGEIYDRMLKYQREFGLTPASESAVAAARHQAKRKISTRDRTA